jgi:21S rRNA (GM2251-2'-O)-methyltransferase
MTYSCINGSSLLWTQRIILPRTFCRYKSITAAIERGRSDGPDRPFRPRSQTGQKDEGDRTVRNRREARFERFGPPRNGASSRFQEDQYSSAKDHVTYDRGSGRTDPRSARPRRPWNDAESGSKAARTRDTADGYSSESRFSQRPDTRGAPRERFGREQSAYARNRPDRASSNSRFSHRSDTRGPPTERLGREQSSVASGVKSSTEVTKKLVRGPETLPYSTAASEFIYGHSSVVAAIKANRRKFYKLYVHSRGASRDGLMSQIRAHKLFAITEEVGDEYMRAMDKASSGRPHNGVILESSPLPVPPITELKPVSVQDESFSVGLGSQSAEDALVNGKQELYTYRSAGWRHPLVLYVDGVVSGH